MTGVEVLLALLSGGVIVEITRALLTRRKAAAEVRATDATTDHTEATTEKEVVAAAKDVVSLLREDNKLVREELREERRARLEQAEDARNRESRLITRIAALEVRLASAEDHAREVGRLRGQLRIASETIRAQQEDIRALGGTPRPVAAAFVEEE